MAVVEPTEVDAELQLQLEILRAVDGTRAVKDFGVEGVGKPQDYGVYLDVQPPDPDAKRKPIRVPCTKDRVTKLDCALAAKSKVAEIVGVDAIEQAERLVMERRAAAGRSSTAPPATALDVIGLTQKLMAKIKSAELRATAAERAAEQASERAAAEAAAIIHEPEAARQAAWQELEAARAALDAHKQQPKRQRVEGEAAGTEAAGSAESAPEVEEPAWRQRPYAKYDTVDKWVKREGVNIRATWPAQVPVARTTVEISV